jgi:PKD repeat protein
MVPSIMPTADFTASKLTGAVPLTVQFTDTSAGNPTRWSWDFGDQTNSMQQNPQHEYQATCDDDQRLTHARPSHIGCDPPFE